MVDMEDFNMHFDYKISESAHDCQKWPVVG